MAIASFEEEVDILFHGVEYILTLSTHENQSLTVELEQESNNQRWRGDFPAKYVEDLTRRTGNSKKFAVFVKMLVTALTQSSTSVYIDLFTYADLEMLKNREARGRGGGTKASAVNRSALNSSFRDNNKRYLILTYAVEFDRVHYPLPLAYCDTPSPGALLRTIRRLKKEKRDLLDRLGDDESTVAGAGGGAGGKGKGGARQALAALRRENAELRRQVRDGAGGDSGKFDEMAAALKAESDNRRKAEASLERLKAASRAEIVRLRAVVEDLKVKLEEAPLMSRASDSEQMSELKELNRHLTRKCRDLAKQLALSGGAGGGVRGAARGAARASPRSRPASARRASPRVAAAGAKRGTRQRSASPKPRNSVTSLGSRGSRTSRGSRSRVTGSSRRSRTPRRAGSIGRGSVSGSDNESTGARRRRPTTAGSSASRTRRPPRFDPTAYQAEQQAKRKQRQRAAAARRSRSPSARSRSPSPSSRHRTGSAPGSPYSAHGSPSGGRTSTVTTGTSRVRRSGGSIGSGKRRVKKRTGTTPRRGSNGAAGTARRSPARRGGTGAAGTARRRAVRRTAGAHVAPGSGYGSADSEGHVVNGAVPPPFPGPGSMLSGSLPATAPLERSSLPATAPLDHSDDAGSAGAGGAAGSRGEYSRRSVDAAFFTDGEDLDRRLKAVEGKLSVAAAAAGASVHRR